MHTFIRELRQSARGLWRRPGFSAVIVVTLALGIGANAAIFSLLDQVLLRRLSVLRPAELVLLDGPGAFRGRTVNDHTFSYPMYVDFRDRNDVFSGVLARFPLAATVVWQGQSERVSGELVSGNYFEVLGVGAALGRVFTQSDDRVPGAHPVAVLSYGYWQRRFGGDPSVLNRPLVVNGHPLTIVGVAADGFTGVEIGHARDVMIPMMMKQAMTPTWNDLDNRRSRWVNVIARLKPGMTAAQAEARMNVIYRQANELEIKDMTDTSEAFRQRFVSKHLTLLPDAGGLSDVRRQFSTPLVVLMCMVGVVLLIACANAANLLLARTASRQKEIAVRLALGAGGARIVRQHLVESLLLAIAGAALGLVLAAWTGTLLLAALPGESASRTLTAAPDARVTLFALALALVTAVVFGIVPALHATRSAVTSALKEEAGSVAGGGRQARLRRLLVVAQVAMSLLLLAGAGLFARSLYNLRSLDPGFRVDQLVTFSVDPTLNGYSKERVRAVFGQIRQALLALPGVRGVSMSEIGMLTGDRWQMTVRVDGYTAREDENMNPGVDGVGPAYLSTMGIPLVAGREFTEKDTEGAPRVAIVNRTMAKYFFGDSNPIGRRIGFGRDTAATIEIVGVSEDVRSEELRSEPGRYLYIPYLQDASLTALTFYVRMAGDATAGAAAIRDAVRSVDSNLPVVDLKRMDAQLSESLFIERMVAALSVAFGVLATVLAAIGLYGVLSYAVARRTREIGIRMALGAERGRVIRLILKEVVLLAGAGLVIGAAAASVLTRQVRAQLFGLSPNDPATLAGAVLLLALVACVAGLIPARRATAIDPNLALRTE
jgi:putative ABC transport system permease protein